MEGGRDRQRKRAKPQSKEKSKPYKSKNSYSPIPVTELAEAESVPKLSPKAALTSCHLSSCSPSSLTLTRFLRPWTTSLPHALRRRPSSPFSFLFLPTSSLSPFPSSS